MQTPTQSTSSAPGVSSSSSSKAAGTVIYLKEAGSNTTDGFVPLFHHHSVTLRDLAEEYNISSVLECDANGAVQPRAVAYDSPSDVLHSGRHYIARRDATTGDGANRVTFRGKILVKEYDLDPHATPSISASFSSSSSNNSVVSTPGTSVPAWALGTPLSAPRFQTAARDDGNEEAKTADVMPALCEKSDDGNRHPQATRTTASSSVTEIAATRESAARSENASVGMKRAREADPESAAVAVGEVQQGLFSTPTSMTGPLADRTNINASSSMIAAKDQVLTASSVSPAPPPPRIGDGNDSKNAAAAAAQQATGPIRFLPFHADLHGTGGQVMVQLSDLAALCADVERLEAENAQRHAGAVDLCASARRVLFAATKR